LIGDWREEVIFRCGDSLRIYSTYQPSSDRLYTLMHDPQYRVAVSWQNTAYNQPPHPGFHIGSGMAAPPAPNIVVK
jgi:rhamnogalacturonan endolyase